MEIKLNTIEEAIEDIRAGKVIIVVDDEDRENEGDFICAAQCITPEIVNFMATNGRGLICTPIEESHADELDLPLMVSSNTALHETAFTVSIDLIGQGCTTGISAYDRSTCIKALVDPNITAKDFARPGHIFPLRAKMGGVLKRTGHTEAAVDLARMAGYYPAGVLVEILNEDGSMARLPQLMEIAKKFELKIVAIKDLVAYRMKHERIVKKETIVPLDTKYGKFEIHAYGQEATNDLHLAIKYGDWQADKPVLVRVHSSTETGDILGLLFDSYGNQMESSLEKIAAEGSGMLLYMRHSDQGKESMLAHLKALNGGQEEDRDMGQRGYGVGAQILRDMGATKLRLITSNVTRRVALEGYGIEIIEYIEP
ncbi:MAG: 3,4-dihydroxy-2-butanone-4-phosphate synthase [Bacteroidota bacterium]